MLTPFACIVSFIGTCGIKYSSKFQLSLSVHILIIIIIEYHGYKRLSIIYLKINTIIFQRWNASCTTKCEHIQKSIIIWIRSHSGSKVYEEIDSATRLKSRNEYMMKEIKPQPLVTKDCGK